MSRIFLSVYVERLTIIFNLLFLKLWKIWLHTPNPCEMEMGAVKENLWWKQGYPAITILDFFPVQVEVSGRICFYHNAFHLVLCYMFPVIGYTLDSGIKVGVCLLIFGLFSSGYVLIKTFFIFYLFKYFFYLISFSYV